MAKSPKKKKIEKKPLLSAEQNILESFIVLAHKKGAGTVTLQDLGKQAGVAHGTVRYHFNQDGRDITQEALLYLIKKAYIYIDDFIFRERKEEDDKFNPLHAYIRAMFSWITLNQRDGSLLVYYYYLCTTQIPLAIPNALFVERARLRIESLLLEAVGRGLYPALASPAETATKIHTVVIGACLAAGTSQVKQVYDQQLGLCLKISDLLVNTDQGLPAERA